VRPVPSGTRPDPSGPAPGVGPGGASAAGARSLPGRNPTARADLVGGDFAGAGGAPGDPPRGSPAPGGEVPPRGLPGQLRGWPRHRIGPGPSAPGRDSDLSRGHRAGRNQPARRGGSGSRGTTFTLEIGTRGSPLEVPGARRVGSLLSPSGSGHEEGCPGRYRGGLPDVGRLESDADPLRGSAGEGRPASPADGGLHGCDRPRGPDRRPGSASAVGVRGPGLRGPKSQLPPKVLSVPRGGRRGHGLCRQFQPQPECPPGGGRVELSGPLGRGPAGCG